MADFTKNASAFLDYHLNWAAWLGAADGLASATWVVPTGLSATDSGVSGATAYLWLSGGAAGATYTVLNGIWTTSGRHQWTAFTLGIG